MGPLGREDSPVRAHVVRLQRIVRQLRRRVAFLEASRFWTLAKWWFALKRQLGLVIGDPPFAPSSEFVEQLDPADPYTMWLLENDVRPADLERLRLMVDVLPHKPTFDIIVFERDPEHVAALATDLRNQVYPHWRLVVARSMAADDVAAVRYNAALQDSSADLVAFVDANVSVLRPHALFAVALEANRWPESDVVYADHDRIGADGVRCAPDFKPDWSPETLLSGMYFGPLVFYRRTLVAQLGGFRPKAGSALHFDLALRATECAERIGHVTDVLYDVRTGDTRASGAVATSEDDAVRIVAEALARRGEAGRVETVPHLPGIFRVRYELKGRPRVGIFVPTRDNAADLDACLASAFGISTYPNFRILVVDNGSKDDAALAVFESWLQREPERLTIARFEMPFNFSRLNNAAAAASDEEVLVFLNDDTKVVTPDWIEAMLEHAQRAPIGAVGARLLYADDTIQHAGIVLGIRGVAGHSHRSFSRDDPGYRGAIQTVANYSAVTAACMMMRREVFDRVGGFDEDLALEFNDIDLCLRVRDAGYRIVYLPHVVLYHAESQSRGTADTMQKIRRVVRERRFMEKRWNISQYRDPYYNPNLTLEAEDYSIRC